MYRLTKYDKETIVRTSEGEDTYDIYTFNPGLKRRLAVFAKKYPECCRRLAEKGLAEGAVTYLIDKGRLSLRLNPLQSEERRRKARIMAKEHGFGSENR